MQTKLILLASVLLLAGCNSDYDGYRDRAWKDAYREAERERGEGRRRQPIDPNQEFRLFDRLVSRRRRRLPNTLNFPAKLSSLKSFNLARPPRWGDANFH